MRWQTVNKHTKLPTRKSEIASYEMQVILNQTIHNTFITSIAEQLKKMETENMSIEDLTMYINTYLASMTEQTQNIEEAYYVQKHCRVDLFCALQLFYVQSGSTPFGSSCQS